MGAAAVEIAALEEPRLIPAQGREGVRVEERWNVRSGEFLLAFGIVDPDRVHRTQPVSFARSVRFQFLDPPAEKLGLVKTDRLVAGLGGCLP